MEITASEERESGRQPGEARFKALAAAGALASLLSYAAVITITPASINAIGRDYKVGPSGLALLFFVLMVGFLAAVLAAGRYSDSRGKLGPITLGCAAMTAGLLIFAAGRSFSSAAAGTLVMGFGGGACEGTSMALIGDIFSGRRRTSMINCSQAVFGVGAVLSPVAVAALIGADMSWRFGYVAVAAVCALSGIISIRALLMRREVPVSSDGSGHGWRELMSNPLVWSLSFGILLYVGAECGQANWLAKYFRGHLRAQEWFAASSVACFWLGITVGRLLAAAVAHKMSEVVLIRWSLGLAATSQATLLLSPNPAAGMAATLALGLFLGPVFPTIVSIASAAYPASSGTITGVVVAFGAVGAAIFPPGIGVLADAVGMHPALWVCFVISVMNLAIFLKLRK